VPALFCNTVDDAIIVPGRNRTVSPYRQTPAGCSFDVAVLDADAETADDVFAGVQEIEGLGPSGENNR